MRVSWLHMRWILTFLKNLMSGRKGSATRHQLFGMYFEESNVRGRRRPNRDRA